MKKISKSTSALFSVKEKEVKIGRPSTGEAIIYSFHLPAFWYEQLEKQYLARNIKQAQFMREILYAHLIKTMPKTETEKLLNHE